ncbi:MAG: acyl--CoA ligase [Clostridiales bacterium]|nr:acyl--CoA ligase [Clostridiales bacterium]
MEEKKLTGYPSIDKPWLKYYSEEAVNAKLPEYTMFEYLWRSNKDHLGDTALRYFDRKISFGEMFDNIEKAAKAFTAIGLKKGDIIIMATVTTPETVYAFYALNRLGIIPNMVDPRTSAEGIREYIREVDAKVVLTLNVAYPKIEKAIAGTNVKKIIVTSPGDSVPPVKKTLFSFSEKIKGNTYNYAKNCVVWKQFIANGSNTVPKDMPYEKDFCCVIVHTGGTTGMPKGVMLSNENVNALVLQSILTGIDMKREHTWMDIMPPFIAYGIGMGLHLPLIIGMETILIPSFDASKFDKLLLKHKPIHMVGVPSYWGVIINSKKLAKKDLSYIIAPTVGGDTMDATLEKNANAFLQEHGCRYPITKGYGMTEVCAGVSGTVDANNEIGSVGIPFVKTIISVFDLETGEELKYNEQGEICISGPNVMLGYYENEAATNAIKRVHKDGTVWIHSGDIGYMNENGSLYIVDRVKKMIVRYDGFKVFPSLIEKTVSSHYAVVSCCAVGTPDKEHAQGKLPVVFVVLKPECTGKQKEIESELNLLCQKELPEYAQPIGFKFVEKLPLTPIGKVDFRLLEKEVSVR